VPPSGATVVTAALGVLLATSSMALAARTDAIVLRNGDHLTGEVVQMRQAKLQVKTDDAGSLSIEWDKVASLTTADQYDVVLRDGSRLLGRLSPGPPQSLHVVAPGGAATAAAMAEIASFTRIKARFLQRIEGSLDLGGSYTKSSGVADIFFTTEARYRRPSSTYAASFAANFTSQPDVPETTRYAQKVSYTRYHAIRWLVTGLGFFEGNKDLGFTFRGTGAASVGRYLARSSHVECLLAGGFAAGQETPVDSSRVTNIDTLITADLSVFTYDYPTTRLDIAVLVFPSLDDVGRVRVNADAKFKRELFKDFFVAVTAYDALDNRPKAGGAERHDFGGSLSFGWTF
jgi:hypothetical protein